MGCAYEDTGFCATLPAQAKATLCANCHLHRYYKGQTFMQSYWHKGLAVIQRGLIVACDHDPADNGRVVVHSLAASGHIVDVVGVAEESVREALGRETMFMLDSEVALFDDSLVRNLLEHDFAFYRAVVDSLFACCAMETIAMMRAVGGGDAYSAVRYVVKYCVDNGIDQLTHEQIALISNRSRPTVTKVMHELVMKEPYLFQNG